MQYTPNYNLIIAEGADAVNPLTQIFPNFSAIDTAMEDNKEAGIGTASEVTTGGVHAIVRTDPTIPIFRYTATSAWTTGDTMTLDGSAVTVHLSDGTAPKSGAYVIGAEVLAVVNGSLVTLLTSREFDGVVSFNSRNGVVVPQSGDYTANMIGYNNTLSGLSATNDQDAIDELAARSTPYKSAVVVPSGSTYATQIAAIKTAYDNLTTDQKKTAVIFNGEYVYHRMSNDLFTFNDGAASSSGITTINLSNNTIYQWRFSTGGNTVNNLSATTDTLTLELAYL